MTKDHSNSGCFFGNIASLAINRELCYNKDSESAITKFHPNKEIDMSIQNIGANIAKMRKAKGATQDDLARAVGVSAQAVVVS